MANGNANGNANGTIKNSWGNQSQSSSWVYSSKLNVNSEIDDYIQRDDWSPRPKGCGFDASNYQDNSFIRVNNDAWIFDSAEEDDTTENGNHFNKQTFRCRGFIMSIVWSIICICILGIFASAAFIVYIEVNSHRCDTRFNYNFIFNNSQNGTTFRMFKVNVTNVDVTDNVNVNVTDVNVNVTDVNANVTDVNVADNFNVDAKHSETSAIGYDGSETTELTMVRWPNDTSIGNNINDIYQGNLTTPTLTTLQTPITKNVTVSSPTFMSMTSKPNVHMSTMQTETLKSTLTSTILMLSTLSTLSNTMSTTIQPILPLSKSTLSLSTTSITPTPSTRTNSKYLNSTEFLGFTFSNASSRHEKFNSSLTKHSNTNSSQELNITNSVAATTVTTETSLIMTTDLIENKTESKNLTSTFEVIRDPKYLNESKMNNSTK